MKAKRFIYWAVIALLLIINVFIIINRNEGFKYFPYKTYSQLYVTDSTLYLDNLNFQDDSLQLIFSLPVNATHYNLVVDSQTVESEVKPVDRAVTIPIKEGSHQYMLIPADSTLSNIIVQADHDKNKTGSFTNEFIYCNLPGPNINVSPYNTWNKGKQSFTPAEVQWANEFFRKNTQALTAKTDFQKLLEVGKILSSLKSNPNGISSSSAAAMPVPQQIILSLQNKVILDCGNYSAMLYYLCSVLEIPNRGVHFMGPDGNWRYGVHYFNEVYLREKQQWVLCDALSNAYMPYDSTRFYNAADIKKLANTNSFQGKTVYTFDNGNLKNVRYDSLNHWHKYYNNNNADLCYLHPGVPIQQSKLYYLKQFYTFDRSFELYSDVNTNNWLRIITKIVLFYLMIAIMVAYLLFEIKNYNHNRKILKTSKIS